jgi:hypothetical protein
MAASTSKQLHWTQRVALVRHNLHTASRSGEFGFFKTLQAAGLMEGTNHAAVLTASLGDEGDPVLAAMDNLNSGLAYVHQDAFKNVYDNVKDRMREEENQEASKSKLYVDITMQKNMADLAIDKMANSAIALINQQPENLQDTAANIWITGITIVADVMEITFQQMNALDQKLEDFIRLEESWNTVKAAVITCITALKGVFFLMDPNNPFDAQKVNNTTRSSSIASASGAMLRRISSAFSSSASHAGGSSPPRSRNASVDASANNLINFNCNSSVSSSSSANGGNNGGNAGFTRPIYRNPSYVRNSVSAGCPTSMPAGTDWQTHKLSMIPPTPATDEMNDLDPFDTSVPPIPDLPAIPVQAAVSRGPLEGNRRVSMAVS